MAAQVFISHSCKDNEKAPPASLSKVEADARAARLKFARDLRDKLEAKLSRERKFKVFLDVRGGLNPGDVWRNGLHNALRTCAAGVVLLTPESLASKWVLKEATILSWRVFVGDLNVLVPIVLGVSRDELKEAGFGALDIDAVQQIDVDDASAADVDEVVARTVAAIKAKVASPLADERLWEPTTLWIERFAQQLRKVIGDPGTVLARQHLLRMCATLGISAKDKLGYDDDPLSKLASQLLLAEDGQVIRFLGQAGDPDKAQRESLKESVASLWVDPTPASRLLQPGRQVIAIDTAEVASLRDYLDRAFCNKVTWPRVVQVEEVTDGTDAAVLEAVRMELESVVDISSAARLKAEVQVGGAVYVLLGPGSTRASVLDSLTALYPPVTFIVAAGARPEEKLGTWFHRADPLRPSLQATEREAAANRFRKQLIKFVQGNAQ